MASFARSRLADAKCDMILDTVITEMCESKGNLSEPSLRCTQLPATSIAKWVDSSSIEQGDTTMG